MHKIFDFERIFAMKTCISSYSYHKLYQKGDFTHHDAVVKTKEFGMDAVELQLEASSVPEGMTLLSYTKELADHAREIGLEVPMFTKSANFNCADPKGEVERLKECVDIAAEAGIHMMRHDAAGSYLGTEPARTSYAVVDRIAPYIRELAEYAAQKGVKTCTENHGRLIQDSDRMERLFAAVNHENYGWLCDMGNFGGVDENCAVAASRLLPSVCFIHAKDSFERSGMMYNPGRGWGVTRGGNYRRATIFGHGDVPTFQILHAMSKWGYDGFVSLEFEGIEDTLLALDIGSENLKRMVKELNDEKAAQKK